MNIYFIKKLVLRLQLIQSKFDSQDKEEKKHTYDIPIPIHQLANWLIIFAWSDTLSVELNFQDFLAS